MAEDTIANMISGYPKIEGNRASTRSAAPWDSRCSNLRSFVGRSHYFRGKRETMVDRFNGPNKYTQHDLRFPADEDSFR